METREQAGRPARGIGLKHSTHRVVGNNRWLRRAALVLLATVATACFEASRAPGDGTVLVASTTSLYDSGLLDRVLPAFEAAHPRWKIRILAVGTGEALELGRRGDVDLLLVHAPEAEEEFLRAGNGVRRAPFMRNDFALAGPASDPAGVADAGSITEALGAIAGSRALFISRGDRSGTHLRELALWRQAGIAPDGTWYREVGQGMGAALVIASEKEGYLLTDRATFLSLADRLDLALLYEGNPALRNVYSAIEVTGARNPLGACVFSRWIRNASTLAEIARYRPAAAAGAPFSPLDGAALDESSSDAESACGAGETGRAR